jgi:cell division protein ZapA
MAQVTLRINGYAYTLGCRDGEEAHLNAMAREVEKRIESVRSMAGQSGESRMLLMAALTMADELYEVEQRQQSGRGAGEARIARRLSRMATRAEEIAAGLEAP